MPQYNLAATEQSESLEAQAAAFSQTSGASSRADDYSLASGSVRRGAVLRGLSTRLHSPPPRMAILGLGYALFLGT